MERIEEMYFIQQMLSFKIKVGLFSFLVFHSILSTFYGKVEALFCFQDLA